MARSLRDRVCGYLRAGSVTVLRAETPAGGPRRPEYVLAHVNGYRSTHRVLFEADRWSCSCPDITCPHVPAVALVTGHDTPVRPNPKPTSIATPIPEESR